MVPSGWLTINPPQFLYVWSQGYSLLCLLWWLDSRQTGKSLWIVVPIGHAFQASGTPPVMSHHLHSSTQVSATGYVQDWATHVYARVSTFTICIVGSVACISSLSKPGPYVCWLNIIPYVFIIGIQGFIVWFQWGMSAISTLPMPTYVLKVNYYFAILGKAPFNY